MTTVYLDGTGLALETVEAVARGEPCALRLDETARRRMEASRALVVRWLERGERIYGVTTGFGLLSDVAVPAERIRDLQANLVRSHASGVGAPLTREETRALMLLRANALARGCSGVRPQVVERLLGWLEAGLHPVIPEAGSAGASGDLAPLAHLALALMGEGEVEVDGARLPAAEALRRRGLEPLRYEAKEGLALVNGTQGMLAVGVLALLRAERALETAEVAGAASLEALRGTPDAFDPLLQSVRPHPGQQASAERLRALLADSEIRESHRYGDPRVQDAYSLRCMPQVHGAARDALAYVRRVLEIEANSATDNPLVFPEEERVLSGGNFHGQPVAQAMDFLAIALADVMAMSERRIERLLNPALSGLPPFLARNPGLESGLMTAQLAAVDRLVEARVLAHPASVDSVPTGGAKEDHVSMGMTAARKARTVVAYLEDVLAVELLCAAQALEFLAPLRPGRGVRRAHALVRERVPPLTGDRPLRPDIEALAELVRSGRFSRLWQEDRTGGT